MLLVAGGSLAAYRLAASRSAVNSAVAGTPSNLCGPDRVEAERRSMVPEYDRTLKRVVISLAGRDATLALHHELLLRLPRYAEIILLVEKGNLKAIRDGAERRPYRDRLRLVAYDGKARTNARLYYLFPDSDKLIQLDSGSGRPVSQHGSLWAQDLFEVTRSASGALVLLASEIHKHYVVADDGSPLSVMRDNAYLACLGRLDLEVRPTPIAFQGGNILVDEIAGRLVAFVGADVLRTTRTARRAFDEVEVTDVEVGDMVKAALNVDTVVVIGRRRLQPYLMYHLDQAMTLLPERVAAVTRVVPDESGSLSDSDEIKQVEFFLSELRSVLRALGYTILDIETTARNLERYQHYVNAVPYIDAETRRRTILMPVFPSDQTARDEELIARNTAALESCGYRVVQVPTSAHELRGGIHCLVNVLE